MQVVIHFRKIAALFTFTLFIVVGYSQNTINSYKYVLLPTKFDFSSFDDQYRLNTTAKLLLEQKGFTVIWAGGNMPQAVTANRCAALVAEVTQRKAFFTTNLTLSLKDCFGNIIFKGKEGKSREKEFDAAYKEALNEAFASLGAVPYKYDSTLSAQPQQPVAATAISSQDTASAKHPITDVPSTKEVPATKDVPATTDAPATLYAQAIPNGYQLIDIAPKKIMTLLKTSMQDCFLAEAANGTSRGIVFKKNDEWLFEYYKDGTLISQKLTIRF